jgi:hypothetical protein
LVSDVQADSFGGPFRGIEVGAEPIHAGGRRAGMACGHTPDAGRSNQIGMDVDRLEPWLGLLVRFPQDWPLR